MFELETCDWDVLLVTETWREAKEEFTILCSGDVFIGSGGTVGDKGVAAFVHRK